MSVNIFEQAFRQQIRFYTAKGLISVEDLWQLPLQSKTGFDLDTIAQQINEALVKASGTSFVSGPSPAKADLELRLEILKHIISVRLQENKDKVNESKRKELKSKLEEALAKKKDAAIESLSEEEIQERLKAL